MVRDEMDEAENDFLIRAGLVGTGRVRSHSRGNTCKMSHYSNAYSNTWISQGQTCAIAINASSFNHRVGEVFDTALRLPFPLSTVWIPEHRRFLALGFDS